MKLSGAGEPLAYEAPGIVDSFGYRNGPLTTFSTMWSDAHDLYPESYDQAVISAGVLNTTAYTPNEWPELVAHPALVGHTLIATDLGLDDDYQVSIRWDTSDLPWCVSSQISPCGFVDLDAANYREVGVKPVWDVSVVATYMQNVFRSESLADVFDYQTIAEGDDDDFDYYDYLSPPAFYLDFTGDSQCMTFRARSGECRGYWNGTPITPVVTVPAWAVGRTWVGIDVIHSHQEIGQPVGGLGPVDHVVEDLITSFSASPFTGTL